MATVLVTGVGGACGIGAVRSLGETTTHSIVGVDMDPDAAGLYLADVGRTVPPADDDEWGPTLGAIIDDHDVDVVVPTVDEELSELDTLPEDVPVVAPRPAVIDVALDKYATHRQLDDAGHTVPRTWLASDAADVPEDAYPLIRKPRQGRGSRGIERVETPDDLQRSLRAAEGPPDDILLQEFVTGTEFTTSVVSTQDDRLLSVVPKEAMAKEGSTVKGATRRQPAVREACRDIAASLSPAGPMNVQQIVADDGTAYTIEINPRFSSTACLTVRSGVDELGLLIRDALGESVSAPPEYEAGVHFLRYDDHVFVDDEQVHSPVGEP